MDDLWPFAVYTCRVAAYTVERGPFSEPLTVVLSDGMGNITYGIATVCIDLAKCKSLCVYVNILWLHYLWYPHSIVDVDKHNII